MDHLSVLKKEVQNYLNLAGKDKVLDATLGLGGHALDILKNIGKEGVLYAFEQDKRNLEEAQKRLKEYEKQIVYINDNFRYLKNRVTDEKFDAILFDLGISSPHVDDPNRGFSFMNDGPLDMRFNPDEPFTAEVVINTYSEPDLSKIFFEYGEERFGRRIARAICDRRKEKGFKTTVELAEFIKSVLPRKYVFASKVHPATKVFQALRIEVNDELNALKDGLQQAFEVLRKGGKLVVISYHSLEDRIVKQFMKKLERPEPKSQEEALYSNYGDPLIQILTKKPVIPTEKEIAENPRSRSAKLRALKKL